MGRGGGGGREGGGKYSDERYGRDGGRERGCFRTLQLANGECECEWLKITWGMKE